MQKTQDLIEAASINIGVSQNVQWEPQQHPALFIGLAQAQALIALSQELKRFNDREERNLLITSGGSPVQNVQHETRVC